MSQRLKRRLLLGMLARQRPDALLDRARRQLPRVLNSAARRSRAYAELLAEAGVTAADLQRQEGLIKAPVLNKQSTFGRFPLESLLASDVRVEHLASVLTSSGYGSSLLGFGLSDRQQQSRTPVAIDLGLQHAFGVDNRKTLVINTLPMGVMFESRAACVANVSVREDMALAILRQAGPRFEQVILVVDPLFAKRFLDFAQSDGFGFSAQRINMVIGEETFQEPFRTYLRAQLSMAPEASPKDPFLGSSMGVAELGLNLFFETPETVALRRALAAENPWERQPLFFCFNPLRTWIEVNEPGSDGVGELLVTMMDPKSTTPLPRYSTGDRVAWVNQSQLDSVPTEVRTAVEGLPFPMVALYGRARDQLSADLHVDDLKALQYRDHEVARQLSSAFRAEVRDGRLHWHLQFAQDATQTAAQLEQRLTALYEDRCTALGTRVDSLADLRVFPYHDFPYGMTLDYERKFRYAGVVD